MAVRQSFWDYFRLTKFFLKAGGILPIDGSPSLWKSILTRFLAVSPLFYGCYISFPEINYVLFWEHDMDDLLEAAIIIITIIGGQFRSIFVAANRHKITRLFSICSELWDKAESTDYEILTSLWAKRARFFATAYFCVSQFSITSFVLATSIKQLSAPPNSTIQYYPFKFSENFTPTAEYVTKYTLQVIIGFVGMSLVAAADMTGTLLALNMCGQISLIQNWLLEVSTKEFHACNNGKFDEAFEVVLKKCISRHQLVLDFCTELEEVVRYINLAQIITGMYVLAISVVRLAESLESYRYLGTLIMSTCGLYFSCWPADTLSSVSRKLGNAVYEVPWYRCSHRSKRAMAIMLARSQRPAQLTAGKFVALSLETFTSILSSSISFCMVLYNL